MKKNTQLLATSIFKYSRKYATKTKLSVEMEDKLTSRIESSELKPRKHPGVMKTVVAEVPREIIQSMTNILKDKPLKAVCKDGVTLSNYLLGRHPPAEVDKVKNKAEEIQRKIEAKHGYDSSALTEEQHETLKFRYQRQVLKCLRHTMYSWKPIDYDEYVSLMYMVARAAPEYAVLQRILHEIKTRDPDFEPNTVFDFGSGVGTTTWAARAIWGDAIKEHFNVDVSSSMNDLASLLLRDGEENREMPIKGVFYRQFLPATHTRKYDLVVSAYTLLELPSAQNRLETILNLWNKTEKYLAIVERGTPSGFRAINEAREFLLELTEEKQNDESVPLAHVFSPCPHDMVCPKFLQSPNPCRFEVSYISLPFEGKPDGRKEKFSYVVLKKGTRSADDPQWPRLVRHPLVRSKHTNCRLCLASGKLRDIVFTASKHGKVTYRCARSSNWGDLLPATVTSMQVEEEEEEQDDEVVD